MPRCASPLPRASRVDPDLLQLDGVRRPGGRLRLEEDRAVLGPQPRAALADPGARPPAKAVGVASSGLTPISSSCAAAQAGTSRSRSAGVASRSRYHPAPEARRARRRAVRAVDARRRCSPSALPQLADGLLLADDHPGASPLGRTREAPRSPCPTVRRSPPRGRAPRGPPRRQWPRTGPGRAAPRPRGRRAPPAPRRRTRAPPPGAARTPETCFSIGVKVWRACRSTSVPSPATTPKPASSRATPAGEVHRRDVLRRRRGR